MPIMKIRRTIRQEVDSPGLGNKIRDARVRDGRTITQLAKTAGISRNYWYQLEAEAVIGGISEEVLRSVESVLGVDFGVRFSNE